VICTFKQGRIADRGLDTQQFRASGLNLVIAAVVRPIMLPTRSIACVANASMYLPN
jgi:hypothetical protein